MVAFFKFFFYEHWSRKVSEFSEDSGSSLILCGAVLFLFHSLVKLLFLFVQNNACDIFRNNYVSCIA